MRHRTVLNPAYYWLGFAILFLGVMAPAFADPNILDGVGNQYKTASSTWEASLIPIAKSLFIKLALIELLWSAIWWVVEREDPNQVIVSMLRKIMPLMFFWAILLNFDTWIPAVIDSFAKAGQTAGNTGPLTPSTVLDRGLEIATTITSAANQIGLFSGPSGVGKYILCGLSALGILLCFGVIAGQMLVTLIESYIVVSGGVLFLGFAGSRWTTTFSEKYISYAVSVGVKLFVTYLIIGAGQHLSDSWAAKITTDMVVSDYLAILVGAMVYMFLAWQIPSLASSMLTGAVSMTLGSAAATVGTMAAGAAGAAGLAQAGLAGAGNSVAGAVQAGSAAIDQARAGGATGIATTTLGAVGALASAGAGAASDAIKGLGSGSTGGSLANRIGERTASIQEAAAAGSPAASVPGGQPAAPAAPAPAAGGPAAPAGGAPAAAGTAAAAAGQGSPGAAGQGSPGAAGQGSAGAVGQAAGGSPAGTRATPPAPPAPATSSVIDTSGNIGQALAERNSGAPATPPAPQPSAQPAAAASSAAPDSAAAPAAAPTSGTPPPGSSASPAKPPSSPPTGNQPPPPPPPPQDRPNALQQLSDHAAALGNMPNDGAAGAGVQINLKHD